MYILGICDAGEVLETFSIVNTIVLIIKIVVPLILIVSGMITFLKAIKDKDDTLLVSAKKSLVTKCIAGICIFFVPTFVNILVKLLYFIYKMAIFYYNYLEVRHFVGKSGEFLC